MLSHSFRVLGGKWRGRKFQFHPETALRPTLSYVRETLFNWLQSRVVGSRCLDAFAGSGALGIEALSRGAHQVTFVDHNSKSLHCIQQHLHSLATEGGEICTLSLPQHISQLPVIPYDLVFLDPPFHSDLLPRTLTALFTSGLVTHESLVYIETTRKNMEFGATWQIHRCQHTKHITYGLLRLA